MKRATLFIITLSSACIVEPLPDDGGQSGEESVSCGPTATTELADDEASVLGFGRTEIAAFAEGAHSATLTYVAGGSAPLELDITLGSARYHDMEWVDDGTGAEATPATEMGCADLVEVDATVLFTSEDGAFAETWETTLDAAEASSASFWMDLDLDALAGSFVYVPDTAYDEVNATVLGFVDSAGTTGSIDGQGTSSTGSGPDDTVSATNLPMASW